MHQSVMLNCMQALSPVRTFRRGIILYVENQSVCSPPPPQRECLPFGPKVGGGGEEQHSLAGVGVGVDDWTESLALFILCGTFYLPILGLIPPPKESRNKNIFWLSLEDVHPLPVA
jgi:hypothetical protein